jgi:erythromycin esterase-like protein
MTWYHGVESPELVFSGFPIWSWRRSDCQQLVDFVLQQIWHMEKHTGPATPFARRGAVASSRAAPAAGRVHLPAWGSANR